MIVATSRPGGTPVTASASPAEGSPVSTPLSDAKNSVNLGHLSRSPASRQVIARPRWTPPAITTPPAAMTASGISQVNGYGSRFGRATAELPPSGLTQPKTQGVGSWNRKIGLNVEVCDEAWDRCHPGCLRTSPYAYVISQRWRLATQIMWSNSLVGLPRRPAAAADEIRAFRWTDSSTDSILCEPDQPNVGFDVWWPRSIVK